MQSRWLVRGALLTATLAFVGFACASPAPDAPAAPSPEVQATATRGAAIADVQRIIAGNLQPTETPLPTPTPGPSCAGAIWWHEARDHMGESRVIQGPVIRTRPATSSAVWLEIGQAYPDPTGLAILVQASAGASLTGKNICVDGRIANVEGATSIDARGAARIVVISQN